MRGRRRIIAYRVRPYKKTRRLEQVDDAGGADVGLGGVGVEAGDRLDVVAGDRRGGFSCSLARSYVGMHKVAYYFENNSGSFSVRSSARYWASMLSIP